MPISSYLQGLGDIPRKMHRDVRSWQTRRHRNRSSATFIAITGSSGKSTCGQLLSHLLVGHGEVESQLFANTYSPIARKIRRLKSSTEYVVVEAGIGFRGRMQRMARVIQPDVAIVTMVGIEHYRAFRSREVVATEKGGLVEAIRPSGLAVLNADDEFVLGMAARTSERIVTFGKNPEADYRVISAMAAYPKCLELDIDCRGTRCHFDTPFVGAHLWLPCVAAITAALELGVTVKHIQERLTDFVGPPFRFQPYPTSGPTFILDTAKAPYGTLELAFSAFAAASYAHKRIVLGNIADFAGSDRPKYRDAYRAARAISDQVIIVDRNLHRYDDIKEDLESGKLIELETAEAVDKFIRDTYRKDELILVKSSKNLHLERVALSWTNNVQCWESKCRVDRNCLECGLYEFPFGEHESLRQEADVRKLSPGDIARSDVR
ncbi:MAG: Mur ligase family protein [Hyphomicrobiaceae bacterium]